MNGKNDEKTLDQFLNGTIPKESELKIIAKEESPKKQEIEEDKGEQIDTTTNKNNFDFEPEQLEVKINENDFKNYIMQEYGDYIGSK